MEIKIYQINRNRDKNFVKFLHYKHLDNFQETKDINASIYDEVFRGDADCEDLEDVYRMFNTEGHKYNDGAKTIINDGEIDGRVFIERDDSAATGSPNYGDIPEKINGGTFKQIVELRWAKNGSPSRTGRAPLSGWTTARRIPSRSSGILWRVR